MDTSDEVVTPRERWAVRLIVVGGALWLGQLVFRLVSGLGWRPVDVAASVLIGLCLVAAPVVVLRAKPLHLRVAPLHR